MITVFISQPMRDKTDKQIETERIAAINDIHKRLTKDGSKFVIVDSFFKDAPHDTTPLWFLGESIKLLGTTDVVYFCKDWQKYNGCIIEHECAVRYGKITMYA